MFRFSRPHFLLNSIELEEGSILKNFLDTAKNLTPEERGKLLENDTSIASVHREFAVEGQTEASGDHDRHHYTVLVNHENELYELDGAQSFPLNHGPTTDETFLQVSFSHALSPHTQTNQKNFFFYQINTHKIFIRSLKI